METVNVLITTAINEENLKQIQAVSSRIRLADVSELAQSEKKGVAAAKKKLDALLADVEIIYGFRLPENFIIRAPKLKWFQTMSAGVDRFLDDEFRRSSVIMTSVKGIHATPIGEFVMCLMLMLAKQAPLAFHQKQQKKWQPFLATTLRSKTVGIVGLGHIGREVARLAKGFGMRVVATRRSARKSQRARYVDRLYVPEKLSELLSESDYVVLTLPLTPETRGIIGESGLRSMKRTAYLINVARGSLVDEPALVRALEGKRIAGAGLDVFATEPLPEGSPLWGFENVIISPHIAGGMEDYVARATGVFCENLRRYLSGRRLINVVDKKKGY
jgi:D-2-hydroxyacid dehydrogenase (NADP+)